MKKTYILDTNVLLTNSKSIFEYKNNDIVISSRLKAQKCKTCHKTYFSLDFDRYFSHYFDHYFLAI